jgi:hypothetical protein
MACERCLLLGVTTGFTLVKVAQSTGLGLQCGLPEEPAYMTRHATFVAAGLFIVCALFSSPTAAQTSEEKRIETRDRLEAFLITEGPKYGIPFRRPTSQEFSFVGAARNFANADYFEVVIGVTDNDVINITAYPHYNGKYVNIDNARNGPGLMRQLLNLNFHNFLDWGADDSGDIYAGHSFTLESGFPSESISVVLDSIGLLDQFIGKIRLNIDGTAASAP